jgi:hypothetical protein
MQRKTSNLQINASKIGLNINAKKTEVMSVNTRRPPKIQLNGKDNKITSCFTYLRSVVISHDGTDKDITATLSKARGAIFKLNNIWKSNNISRYSKIRLYNSCALSVLMYGAECGRMTESDINKLSTFHNGCIRKILKTFWPSKITIKNLYETTKTTNMRTLLKKKYRWRWMGHI